MNKQSGEMRSPRVLMVTAEAFPLVKTGGLGDVMGSLSSYLRAGGADVRILMPSYGSLEGRFDSHGRLLTRLACPHSKQLVGISRTALDREGVPVFLVENDELFGRTGDPYSDSDGKPWADNAARFGTLCDAACQLSIGAAAIGWQPDIVHCHDWHTGLTPALLSLYRNRPATVFTIHSIAHQGRFPRAEFDRLGLPPQMWSFEALEFHGQLSFIKGGLAFADRLTTVSPSYAEELKTPEFGNGLDDLIRYRADRLQGILNGVDYGVWDPGTDSHIAKTYTRTDSNGKVADKRALQREFGLHERSDAFLIGHVGRMSIQKGSDLLCEAMPSLLSDERVQMIVVGSGDKTIEAAFKTAASPFDGQIGVFTGYDESLAHRVLAGADAFVMPSRFEPCGLTQLYSLHYGTVPIVRSAGGLKDTVTDASPKNIAARRATGFRFGAVEDLGRAVKRALKCFQDAPEQWRELMDAGMSEDFSWHRSAARYMDVYRDVLSEPRASEKVMDKRTKRRSGVR